MFFDPQNPLVTQRSCQYNILQGKKSWHLIRSHLNINQPPKYICRQTTHWSLAAGQCTLPHNKTTQEGSRRRQGFQIPQIPIRSDMPEQVQLTEAPPCNPRGSNDSTPTRTTGAHLRGHEPSVICDWASMDCNFSRHIPQDFEDKLTL